MPVNNKLEQVSGYNEEALFCKFKKLLLYYDSQSMIGFAHGTIC